MMRCVLRTNRSAQDLLRVRLRSDVVLDADMNRFGSVKLIEHSTQKIDPAAVHDLVATHKDSRFAATSAFLKT